MLVTSNVRMAETTENSVKKACKVLERGIQSMGTVTEPNQERESIGCPNTRHVRYSMAIGRLKVCYASRFVSMGSAVRF